MKDSPYSFQSLVGFINSNFAVLLLVGLTFVGGFFLGSLWTENQNFRTNKVAAQPADNAGDAVAPQGPTAEQLAQAPAVDMNSEHVRGSKNAKVVLVTYSDFECPFCARFKPTLDQVLKDYGDQVAVVFRHFPLSFHPQAGPAAQASECVAKLAGEDAFWKFHDEIFLINTNSGGITRDDIFAAATKAGANRAQVESCVDGGEFATLVKEQMDGGSLAGINGTPGTIVIAEDGTRELISGALPVAQVKVVIDKYLNK